MHVFDKIGLVIAVLGITVIVWGALLAVIAFLRNEWARVSGDHDIANGGLKSIRLNFGSYLLLGLEFLVAADIIHTIVQPNLSGLAVLGAIVLIRTVISYFLTKELTAKPFLRT